MQLSKFTDYAFRSLIYLANNREKLCTVEELAKELQVSEHHLKKVIHKLGKTDYINSIKGRSGGLSLGMEPREINLGEILKITEDNLSIVECFNEENRCPLMLNGCKLKGIIQKSLDKFIKEFSEYTLEDILN